MIDHLELKTLAAASIDGPLAHSDQMVLEGHLSTCAACRRLLTDLRNDQRRLGNVGEMAVTRRTREIVVIEARLGRRTRPWALLAAAALLAVATAVALGGGTGSRIRSITGTADGLIAVGSSGGRAAVWTSADGSTWDVTIDLPGGAGAELTTIAVGGPGLIAAGRSGSGPGIWLSVDGRSWRSADPPAAVEGLSISAVIPGSRGWLAVGSALDETGMHGLTLVSRDGLMWERSTPFEDAYGMPPLQTGWALPDGRWQAVATFQPGDRPGAFVSDDGITWIGASPASILDRIGGTTSFRSRLFVFGLESPTVQESTEGATWIDVDVPVTASEALAGVTTLRDDEIVLLGSADGGPLVLRSADGSSWQREILPSGGRATAYDMASHEGVEVVVGILNGGGAVWIRKR